MNVGSLLTGDPESPRTAQARLHATQQEARERDALMQQLQDFRVQSMLSAVTNAFLHYILLLDGGVVDEYRLTHFRIINPHSSDMHLRVNALMHVAKTRRATRAGSGASYALPGLRERINNPSIIALPRWIQKNENAKPGHTSYKWPTKTAEDLVESRTYTIAVEQDDGKTWHVVLQQTLPPGEVNLVGNHGLHGDHRTSIQHKLLIVRPDRARFECPVVFVDPGELGPPTELTTAHHPAERTAAAIGKGNTVFSRRHHRAAVSRARW